MSVSCRAHGCIFLSFLLKRQKITTVGSELPENITFQGKRQKKSAMGRSVPKRWAQVDFTEVFRIWQAGACDSGNKIAASAHGMGSGGLAFSVDAMAIGCLGVDRRVELFFPYLAIFPNCHCQKSLCVLVVYF